MIPENQQEALRKLTSKEALLGLMIIGAHGGLGVLNAIIDSDGFNYVRISGQADLNEGDGSEYFELLDIPKGMLSAGSYVATNDNGGGGSINVQISGTTATFTFNEGARGRTVYFSVLLSKFGLGF